MVNVIESYRQMLYSVKAYLNSTVFSTSNKTTNFSSCMSYLAGRYDGQQTWSCYVFVIQLQRYAVCKKRGCSVSCRCSRLLYDDVLRCAHLDRLENSPSVLHFFFTFRYITPILQRFYSVFQCSNNEDSL